MLDVQLDVRGDRAARAPSRLRDARGVEAGPPHHVHELLAVDGRHVGDRGGVELPAERARAEQAAVASLLVAPRRHGERTPAAPPSCSAIVCRHSSPAITPSAPSSVPPSGTVSMWEPVTTAGRCAEAIRAGGAEHVAGAVDPAGEPGGADLAEQPRARFLVGRAPAVAGDPATGQRAEAGELGETSRQTFASMASMVRGV